MSGKPIPEDLQNNVLQMLASGKTQTAIADELGLTQPRVSYIQKKAAIKNGQDNLSSGKTGTMAFIHKSINARDDANCWSDVGKQSVEIELAIDMAELAASAWRDAANRLRNRK